MHLYGAAVIQVGRTCVCMCVTLRNMISVDKFNSMTKLTDNIINNFEPKT